MWQALALLLLAQPPQGMRWAPRGGFAQPGWSQPSGAGWSNPAGGGAPSGWPGAGGGGIGGGAGAGPGRFWRPAPARGFGAARAGVAPPSLAAGAAGPLLYLVHIPKTAGTSLIDDMLAYAGVAPCGPSLLLHACFRKKGLRPNLATISIAARYAACNFTACELNVEDAIASASLRRPLQLVVFLREPSKHVVSMYAMCQSSFALGAHVYSPIGLNGWLRATNASGGAVSTYCDYDPNDIQSARLSPWDKRALKPHLSLRAASARVQSAFAVGTTEQYRASLCLLLRRLGKARPDCACGAAPLKVRHVSFGTKSSDVVVDAEARVLISQMTRNDRALYALAKRRLYTELEQEGLTCLLEPEKHAKPKHAQGGASGALRLRR